MGSSGNFRGYSAERPIRVDVVSHDDEYLSFTCREGYAATVEVPPDSSTAFSALNITNMLLSGGNVWIWLSPDYSGLPPGLDVWVESEDGTEVAVPFGTEYSFSGLVTVDPVPQGEYYIPVTLYARWDGGDAVVETCPIRVIVKDPPLRKVLLSGNTTVLSHTYQEWTFQIVLTNPGEEDDFVVKDTIPGEFDVLDVTPSKGTHTLTPHGYSHELLWSVHLEAGETAHVNVTIATRINGGGNQEFTDCGIYPLNDGARVVGTDIVSNSLEVESVCGECEIEVNNTLVDPPSLSLPLNTPMDYTTRLTAINNGAGRAISITQDIGEHFNVTAYTPSKGTVAVVVLNNGNTRIVWNLYLANGEVATLEINEHTDGIGKKGNFILAGTPKVGGCGNSGSSLKVHVFESR
ncbi:hypothetical protein [Palaeococcus ferrophilus]|uniref:hypothetical protein n=1 Tax=Palaeococcus ferrophilus TaxID=83868 RepID=UPI001B80BFFF|nr:hypothetical protein [Palaeococcus ferrophilus]